jgi:catechol 2,3-dioxygenase-like lactoylglutathione lyase family enzyme
MLSTSPIQAFVPTTDAPRARAFFEDILGLKLQSEDPYALVFDANGTPLRVVRVETLTPQPFTILGWHVDDIAAEIRELTSHGVHFEHFEGVAQDDLGIWSTPGGYVAWFKDPDGNTLSLSQSAH